MVVCKLYLGGFPGPVVKNLPSNAGDMDSIFGGEVDLTCHNQDLKQPNKYVIIFQL